MAKAVLTGENFRDLVAGKEVEVPVELNRGGISVTLILLDIGFSIMREAIDEAERNKQ